MPSRETGSSGAAVANGLKATATGLLSSANGTNATATGQHSNANGFNATAMGQGSTASGATASAFGQGGYQSQIGGLQSQINNVDRRLRDGVAVSMAAGGVPAVPQGRKVGVFGNIATYDGHGAAGRRSIATAC